MNTDFFLKLKLFDLTKSKDHSEQFSFLKSEIQSLLIKHYSSCFTMQKLDRMMSERQARAFAECKKQSSELAAVFSSLMNSLSTFSEGISAFYQIKISKQLKKPKSIDHLVPSETDTLSQQDLMLHQTLLNQILIISICLNMIQIAFDTATLVKSSDFPDSKYNKIVEKRTIFREELNKINKIFLDEQTGNIANSVNCFVNRDLRCFFLLVCGSAATLQLDLISSFSSIIEGKRLYKQIKESKNLPQLFPIYWLIFNIYNESVRIIKLAFNGYMSGKQGKLLKNKNIAESSLAGKLKISQENEETEILKTSFTKKIDLIHLSFLFNVKQFKEDNPTKSLSSGLFLEKNEDFGVLFSFNPKETKILKEMENSEFPTTFKRVSTYIYYCFQVKNEEKIQEAAQIFDHFKKLFCFDSWSPFLN